MELEAAKDEARRSVAELARVKTELTGGITAASKMAGQLEEQRKRQVESARELAKYKAPHRPSWTFFESFCDLFSPYLISCWPWFHCRACVLPSFASCPHLLLTGCAPPRVKAELEVTRASLEEIERLLKESQEKEVDLSMQLSAAQSESKEKEDVLRMQVSELEAEKRNGDEALTLAVEELAQYQEGLADHEALVTRVEEAEKEISEGKRKAEALTDELARRDEEISRMRENAVEREKVGPQTMPFLLFASLLHLHVVIDSANLP